MSDLLDNATGKSVAAKAADNLPAVSGESPGELLSAIVMLARDPSVDVSKLDALLKMQERMEGRQAEAEFNRAFHEMEPKLPRIKKNGDVEYQGKKAFKFARWEDVDEGIRPILREHGFSLSFNTVPRQGEGGGLVVSGTLLHTAGHSRSASIPLPLDASGGKNNLQGAGSTLSYGKRYATQMLLNITTEGQDDDGVRGGMRFITPAQVTEIEKLLKDTKSDVGRFLQMMGVANIEGLETGAYTVAKNMLMAKAKPQGERP